MNRSCQKCRTTRPHRTRTYACPGCGLRTDLCVECGNTYVTCSKQCQETYRKAIKAGLPKELLAAPAAAKVVPAAGYAKFQAPLC